MEEKNKNIEKSIFPLSPFGYIIIIIIILSLFVFPIYIYIYIVLSNKCFPLNNYFEILNNLLFLLLFEKIDVY